ncbi:hypothetical protein V2J09_004852 [Rumex salicifolius]
MLISPRLSLQNLHLPLPPPPPDLIGPPLPAKPRLPTPLLFPLDSIPLVLHNLKLAPSQQDPTQLLFGNKKSGPSLFPYNLSKISPMDKVDVAELVNKWNLTLVGAPTNIIGPKIIERDNGLFVFHFEKEEDFAFVLERGPWMLRGQRPIILRRWYEGMELDLLCLDVVPIWITLPNLDVCFWSEHMLAKIGSAIGTLILTDFNSAHQEKLSFVRVLVEISANTELLREIQFCVGRGRNHPSRDRSLLAPTLLPQICDL